MTPKIVAGNIIFCYNVKIKGNGRSFKWIMMMTIKTAAAATAHMVQFKLRCKIICCGTTLDKFMQMRCTRIHHVR